jgi:cytochrome c-type protein NapB
MRRGARRIVEIAGLCVALAAVTLVIADPQEAATSQPAADDARAVRELIRSLGETDDAYGTPSPQHIIAAPTIVLPGPPQWTPHITDTDAARRRTLAQRAAHRAYDGAPPVMPHSRNFVKSKTCLDCHADGIWLGERFGPPLSHPQLVHCGQCHVETKNLELPFDIEPLGNTFSGQIAPHGGAQAWAGAPPVMPHTTLMRSRCTSCHGPESYPGLRTDHPYRLNCTQCHAPAAALDQTSPFFTGTTTLVETELTGDP